MSQLFLDPRSVPANCSQFNYVPAALPASVRKLGVLPDLQQLLPGDLLLFSPISPSLLQKGIAATQLAGGFHQDDARWTHAAVYLGSQFSISEATRKGVAHASLLDSLTTHLVRVRRDTSLDCNSCWKIALAAALQIDTGYGFRSALKIWVRSIIGHYIPQRSPTKSRSELICSELYQDAFLSATGQTLGWNHPGKDVSPALLSQIQQLTDVQVDWQKI